MTVLILMPSLENVLFDSLPFNSALQDHEKNDLDRDHDHLTKYDLRSRSDSDLT